MLLKLCSLDVQGITEPVELRAVLTELIGLIYSYYVILIK